MHVEVAERSPGDAGLSLVLEAEGIGLTVAPIAVEQQARGLAVYAAPEIVGGVRDLGLQDGGGPWAKVRALEIVGGQGTAPAADGVFQGGHLIGEARHGRTIRSMYSQSQQKDTSSVNGWRRDE